MAPMFSRLLRRTRRPSPRDPSAGEGRPGDAVATALEDIDWGPPPVLLPAAIFRQVLYDPAEFSPAWLTHRPATTPFPGRSSEPEVGEIPTAKVEEVAEASTDVDVEASAEPKPAKRPRRVKAAAAPAAGRTRSRRASKPAPDPGDA